MLCTLCDSSTTELIPAETSVEFHICSNCDLIFKDPKAHWDWELQKNRYDQHNNQIDNPGYTKFFEQLLTPLKPHLQNLKTALDWGAGPGDQPVLAELLKREGFSVDLYDPIYFPQLKGQVYDLVTSTEVLEHFLTPKESLTQCLQVLRSGGVFAGLTQFHQGPETIAKWWYVRDPTHVVFYSEKTFRWISKKWNLKILELKNPVFIFEKC